MFLILWFTGCALVAALGTLPLWRDVVIVWAMRTFHIYAYPEAIRLAISLERDEREWRFTSHGHAEHQTIGEIRHIDQHHSLHVLIRFANDTLDWRPNKVERRIIGTAAVAARTRVIAAQLDRVLPR